MNQPTHGGRWQRDPETGAVTRVENTEAIEAAVKPQMAEGEALGAISTNTSASTNTTASRATKSKGR